MTMLPFYMHLWPVETQMCRSLLSAPQSAIPKINRHINKLSLNTKFYQKFKGEKKTITSVYISKGGTNVKKLKKKGERCTSFIILTIC